MINFLNSAGAAVKEKWNSLSPPKQGMLSDLAGSVTGNAQKALLIVNEKEIPKEERKKRIGLRGKTKQALEGNLAQVNHPGPHVLQVQYNPSSISFQANAESILFHTLQPRVDSSLPNQEKREASITMSVDLIFDAENDKDAFMADKFRLSANDVVSDAAAVKQALHGGYTVRPQTNALIAAVMRDYTRTVTFRWADMEFLGEITQVQAHYTMFSVSGNPIRSVVSLYISQRIESDPVLSDYWDNAFDSCFQPDSAVGKSALQKAGNLLNVKF